MNESTSESLWNKPDYFYAVLNVPKHASQTEINERHRSLSLVFHPDKQTNEARKSVAAKEFLEVQKAYQVLSDPFLRQVYDTLGPEGLKVEWPSHLRTMSEEQIRDILQKNKINFDRQRLRNSVLPRGQITCQLNASPLFMAQEISSESWITGMKERLSEIRAISRSLVYSAEKRIGDKTTISLEGQSNVQRLQSSFRFLGTVRHQFSPRIVTSATVNIFRPINTKLELNYEDPNNTLNVKTTLRPFSPLSLPTTTISFSRRLFRRKPQRGRMNIKIAKVPSISFHYISPPTIDIKDGDDKNVFPQLERGPPTISGLKYALFDRTIGLTFDSILPQLVAEVGLSLLELSTRLQCGVRWGLTGIIFSLGANWSNDTAEVASTLILNNTGIIMQLECGYLDQRLTLPIILSTHFSPALALGATVIPSLATVLGYYYVIIPRRRAQRQSYLRTIKREFEQDSDARKERNAVEALLRDSVKRHVCFETEREVLVIREATYSAADDDPLNERVVLDVKIPLQALVRNSQLYIPGGDTKAALQGFSDPSPFAPKILCIRYLFRGREHYAEIPDYLPVVLPLAEHQISGH